MIAGFATSSGSHFPFDAHTSRRRDASSLMSLPARLTGSINDAPPEDETSHDSLRQPLLQRRRQPREERMLHLLSLYLIVPCWCLVIGFAAGCLNMADSCHVTFSLTSLAMATALCLVSARYEHKAKRGRHWSMQEFCELIMKFLSNKQNYYFAITRKFTERLNV